ncbi:hypothetical protein yc1106_02739 [Curvularia clavata]|uniref:Uncharacterized protein n=1 Tax=Curvularia clavata TaxID=95742 RepID=A0A9Q8Z4D2_CURCL|nr:hypothetical protein yc1106_02739 [Curvularia clavata]
MSYDCYSIVKADEQALMLSGYPVLTPLPTQTPYTANESQLCSEDCEQNQTFSEHAMSNSNLSSLGGLSPPTPEPMVFHEPVPVAHCIDYSSFPQPWCEEVSASIEYDFGSIITDIVSPDTWTMSNTAITIPSTSHIQWPQPDPIFQQPRIRMEQISYPDGIGTYSGSQSSSEGCFSSPIPDWRMFEPVGAELSTNASTSLLLNMSSGWEDGFVCEPSSYQMF